MKLDWIILAEGFGTASNGAVTAIGINQHIVIAPNLPTHTKRGVMAHYSNGSALPPGQELEVSMNVSDPAGTTIVAMTTPARPNIPLSLPGVQPGIDIFLEIPLRLTEYGSYEVTLSLSQPGDEPIVGHVAFYVAEPPAVTPSS